MMSLRNPFLLVVCLMLAANLVLNKPQPARAPHPPRQGYQSRPETTSPWASADEGMRPPDAALGQVVYASNCTSCHGPRGHGMPRQGVNLRQSRFIADHTDAQLLAFLRHGRQAGDPGSVMGLMMPARGGNRSLDDAALADIVAFLRDLQEDEKHESLAAATATSHSDGASGSNEPVPPVQPLADIAR